MKYHLVFKNGRVSAADAAELEVAWRKLRVEENSGDPQEFRITLPIPLEARVERTPGKPTEMVILTSNGREVALIRDAFNHPEGQLGVSCSPNGTRVDVDTINIHFRTYDDDCTDRGLVWVKPCSRDGKAEAYVVLRPGAFKRNGLVAELMSMAEAAVERDVLSHFTAQITSAN